ASVILLKTSATTRSITTSMFGALRISTHMAIGRSRPITVGSGNHIIPPSISTPIGRRIDMATGFGVRRTVGPGWDMSHGVGPLITTDAVSFTTGTGHGVLVAPTSAITVGGVPHSSLLSLSTTIIAGIRSTITNEIPIHDITTDIRMGRITIPTGMV